MFSRQFLAVSSNVLSASHHETSEHPVSHAVSDSHSLIILVWFLLCSIFSVEYSICVYSNFTCVYMRQVTRDVTSSLVASMNVAAVKLSRASDVNAPPVQLQTASFTMTASRNDLSGLANLTVGAGNATSVNLPNDFRVDTSDSVLVSVRLNNMHLNIQSELFRRYS